MIGHKGHIPTKFSSIFPYVPHPFKIGRYDNHCLVLKPDLISKAVFIPLVSFKSFIGPPFSVTMRAYFDEFSADDGVARPQNSHVLKNVVNPSMLVKGGPEQAVKVSLILCKQRQR